MQCACEKRQQCSLKSVGGECDVPIPVGEGDARRLAAAQMLLPSPTEGNVTAPEAPTASIPVQPPRPGAPLRTVD
ncbi:hypothetical protein CEXT_742221 [Caerostris extrusa]|uniref:Uncharacterized protein n=1 Tax=Caerostris extrusa TaxID=172846 RepID=A0AAV4XY39_CAEEX|nr:hypothetical protein CEXT_742221 [Caerostris extrusa]